MRRRGSTSEIRHRLQPQVAELRAAGFLVYFCTPDALIQWRDEQEQQRAGRTWTSGDIKFIDANQALQASDEFQSFCEELHRVDHELAACRSASGVVPEHLLAAFHRLAKYRADLLT